MQILVVLLFYVELWNGSQQVCEYMMYIHVSTALVEYVMDTCVIHKNLQTFDVESQQVLVHN